MMKAILVSFFLAPLALAAQTNGSGAVSSRDAAQTTTIRTTMASVCPVGLRAQHLSDGSMVKTRDKQPEGIGQRLHLSFTSASHPVARATMNVRGWTTEGRMEQAAGKADKHSTRQGADGVRTLTAPVTDGAADVRAPGLTAVTSIELVSLEYADGTTWTQADAGSCYVVPDPLMLVGAR